MYTDLGVISVSGDTHYTRSNPLGAIQVSQYVAESAGLPARSVVEGRLAVASDGLLLRAEAPGLLLRPES